MATNYPTSIDSPTNPTPTNPMNAPSHAGEHDNANDAIVALETALGTTASPNVLKLAGGTMSGPIAMAANKITGLANGSAPSDAVAFGQLPAGVTPATTVTGPDSFGASAVVGTGTLFARSDHDHGLPAAPADLPLGGGTMSGDIAMATHKITGIGDGSGAQDAAAFHQIPSVAGLATLASPTFTGTVTVPDAVNPTDAAQLSDVTDLVAGLAPLASPALTGTPTAPTAAALTNTTQLATTAFDTAAVGVETTRATTAEALLAPLASPALTGSPTAPTQAASDNSTKIATDAYVTTAVANAVAGVNPAIAVLVATTAAGNTSALTYANGVSGIGATLTGTVNTAITIDGVTFTAVNQRLLVKNDTQSPSGAFNGIYFLSVLQTAILAPVFTRALDYDTPSDINNTGSIPVQSGTANISTSWLLTSQVATVGTSPLTFVQFSINPILLAPLASPTFTGTVTVPDAVNPTDAAQLSDVTDLVVSPATTVTGPDSFGASAVVGTGTLYARNDHDHGLPANPVSAGNIEATFAADAQIYSGTGAGTGELIDLLAALKEYFTADNQVLAGTGTGTGEIISILTLMEEQFTAAGQILVGTGSATGSLLANGTTGQVLTATTGAAPGWAAAAGGTSIYWPCVTAA